MKIFLLIEESIDKSNQINTFPSNSSQNAKENRNKIVSEYLYTVAAETFPAIIWSKSGINDLMRTRRMLVRAESRRILSDSFEVDVSARGRRGGGWRRIEAPSREALLRIALASAFVRSSR